MASTTALFTGLSGLNAHARRLDVIGNNIANVNTTAFKGSRAVFQTMFSRTMRPGSEPGDTTGGADPAQVGLGVRVGAIQKDMSWGTINPTGDPRDLAIDGNGFFILREGGRTSYTRDGAFRLDGENFLTAPTGARLQGYPVDASYNVLQGALSDLSVPLGRLTLAEPTENVTVSGNLNASGLLPGQGSFLTLGGTAGGGLTLVGGGVPTPATPLTAIADPEDANVPPAVPLFAPGQRLELSGASKGQKDLPEAALDITAATTVQDVLAWLEGALGIHATGPNPDGRTPGVALNPATGAIEITGNTGTKNALAIAAANLQLKNADGTLERLPLIPEVQATADGESVRTTLTVYDSLGTPLNVDVTLTLEGKDVGGTVWRYYVESAADTDLSGALATGTLRFDTNGQILNAEPVAVTLDRAGSGAASPLVFNLSFAGPEGRTSALTDATSALKTAFRDGLSFGTLQSFSVAADGKIQGSFDNGAIRTLGQVALATFTNPGGLLEDGANGWVVGPNAGQLAIGVPDEMGAGAVIGGALELSNVDLGREFIDLIMTQTGYSASTRVIRATDELMQQLLVLGR